MRLFLLLAVPSLLAAQSMSIEEYEPRSSLVVPEHKPARAKYPFIDVHNHQDGNMPEAELRQTVKDMDGLNLRVMVNLSGSFGNELKSTVEHMKGRYPGRFVIFANLNFKDIDSPDYGARTAAQLETDVKAGAQGLKLFKNFGMDVKDSKGHRVPVDDPRFAPVWAMCAKLNIPVLIHTADPKQFWERPDKFNERWLELKLRPGRRRPAEKNASWETLMSEQHHLFGMNPKTKFINAHLGWLGGDLEQLGQLLDRLPNMYTEIGAVLAELGRQPKAARAFLIRYQDRVMLGKDSWAPAEYLTYFRVLETGDEYFDYYRKYHAFWKMYGLELPDDVLKKIYYKNALLVIPGISAAGFPE